MLLEEKVIFGRLLLAVFIGMLMGIERERMLKPAGVRTHMLICLNACIITMISAYGFKGLGTVSDPARLIVGILQGIGFLGAGIIWRTSSGGVMGITTAEVFLLTSLGIGCGLGFYFLTLVSAALTYFTLITPRLYLWLRSKLQSAGDDGGKDS